MPGVYDPRRYCCPSNLNHGGERDPDRSVSAPSEVLAASCFRIGNKFFASSMLPTQTLSSCEHHLSGVHVTLPADVSPAVEASTIGSRSPPRRGATTTSRPRSTASRRADDQDLARSAASAIIRTATSSTPTSPLASRGPARRRSLSWHYRERLRTASIDPVVSYTRLERLTRDEHLATVGITAGRGGGGVTPASAGTAGETTGANAAEKHGERIDAEQLFRRNKQFRHNVAFNGWAERYDRSMAKRALLKRKKREEDDHEADLRRRRAEVEFQKWLCNHAESKASKAGSRKKDHRWEGEAEGASGRPPERAPSSRKEGSAKCEDESEAGREGRMGNESNGQGPERGREKALKARGPGEDKWRENDEAFRKWLDRKRKQAQSERQAREQREATLEKRRKLEASRRWKKRPMVCAYTYGAMLGARQWRCCDGREDEKTEEARLSLPA